MRLVLIAKVKRKKPTKKQIKKRRDELMYMTMPTLQRELKKKPLKVTDQIGGDARQVINMKLEQEFGPDWASKLLNKRGQK